MDTTSCTRHFLYILLFILDISETVEQPDFHAPCMGCRLFNMAHKESPDHNKSTTMCVYPCQCPVESLECQAGVNVIKDGCGCCYMCGRQLGDMCSVKDKCDVSKGLYCSVTDANKTGTCMGQGKKPCKVMGATYLDGEKFYMGCSKLCTCQNGFHGCADLCPQERLKPSELTCHDPKLMKVKDKCCREWTCQKLDTTGQVLSRDKGLESGSLIMKNPIWYRTSAPPPTTTAAVTSRPSYGMTSCRSKRSDWSPCSVTCGVGVSLRLVVDKSSCQNREEQQLCYLRPCGVKVATLGRDKCTPTTRSDSRQHIRFQDCLSLRKYRPKFCTNCKKTACCYPKKYRTKSIEFQCTGGKTEIMDFMWIRKCQCRSKCYQQKKERNKRRRGRKWKERRRMRRKERKRRKWRRYQKKRQRGEKG